MQGVQWSVFADLERHLTLDEAAALFAALDADVAGSGCLGPNRAGTFEVAFSVEAAARAEAEATARRALSAVLAAARLDVGFYIEVAPECRAP